VASFIKSIPLEFVKETDAIDNGNAVFVIISSAILAPARVALFFV
jgi:hypothetical protein